MSMVTVNQYWENEANKNKKNKGIKIRLATVTGLTPDGSAIIQFREDSEPSKKKHPQIKSYVPVVGERVVIINGIILGGIKN